ncbi:hypothetical protein RhiirB3_448002 [Rhizophagus irregularis]|nr:hypothetical protein RhiirB3_448002 [Rhizophagus irregularis]
MPSSNSNNDDMTDLERIIVLAKAIKARALEEFSRVRFYVKISSQLLLFSNPILTRTMFNEL